MVRLPFVDKTNHFKTRIIAEELGRRYAHPARGAYDYNTSYHAKRLLEFLFPFDAVLFDVKVLTVSHRRRPHVFDVTQGQSYGPWTALPDSGKPTGEELKTNRAQLLE